MGYVDHAREMRGGSWDGDEYKALFDKAVKGINSFWDDKVNDYLLDDCPGFAKQINASEDRLNRLWGNASVAEFRQELVNYYKLHVKVHNKYMAD